MTDITATELKKRLDENKVPVLIDVRQREEVAIAAIPGSIHVPMGDIPSRLQELDKYADDEVVVYCHHGMRSANVQQFLMRQGFTNVRNLIGGIDAYSVSADPSIPRY